MVNAVEFFIQGIKDTQKARDLMLAEAEDLQDQAEELSKDIAHNIAFMRAIQGHLHDEEAEKRVKEFLDEVDGAGK